MAKAIYTSGIQSQSGNKSLNFWNYDPEQIYYNNDVRRDFVTYVDPKTERTGLYVCVKDTVPGKLPTDSKYFMLLFDGNIGKDGTDGKDGKDGKDGSTPKVEWVGNKLKITVDNKIIYSPDFTTYSYVPQVINGKLVFKRTTEASNSEIVLGEIKGKSAYEIAVENGFVGTEQEWLASLKGEPGDNTGYPGPQGKSVDLFKSGGYLMKQVEGENPEILVSLDELKGPKGDSGSRVILFKNNYGDVCWRYATDSKNTNRGTVIFKKDIRGEHITEAYVRDEHLYIKTDQQSVTIDCGKITGKQGEPGKNIILRFDSDNAKTESETKAPGMFIQWKYEGEEHTKWRNLIQLNELLNLAFAGFTTKYLGIDVPESGEYAGIRCHHYSIDYNQVQSAERSASKDAIFDNRVIFDNTLLHLGDIYIPIQDAIKKIELLSDSIKVTSTSKSFDFDLVDVIPITWPTTADFDYLATELMDYILGVESEFKAFKNEVESHLNWQYAD